MDYAKRKRSSRVSACSKFLEQEIQQQQQNIEKRRLTITTDTSSTMPPVISRSSIVQSQWELLMRKFSQDIKQGNHFCQSEPPEDLEEVTCELRPLKTFSTGSTYEGTWDALGMCGYGIYTFPNGVVYEGEFEDNMFHGDGEMKYADGTRVRGKWNYGDLIDRTIVFNEEVKYKEDNWQYCHEPDRRYAREYFEDIKPAGVSNITSEQPTKEIPPGMYDAGDGFFDPANNTIFDYNDLNHIKRRAGDKLRAWIIDNCRKSPDNPIGPRPEFYEKWTEPTLERETPPFPACLSEEPSEEAYFGGRPSTYSTSSRSSRHYDQYYRPPSEATFRFEPRDDPGSVSQLSMKVDLQEKRKKSQ